MIEIAPDRSLDRRRLPAISSNGMVGESVVVKTQPKKKVSGAGAPPRPPKPPKGPTGGGKDRDKWDSYKNKDFNKKQYPPKGKGKY